MKINDRDILFQSILDNTEGYKRAVHRIIGHGDYLFADDVISFCIEKLIRGLDKGVIRMGQITYKGTGLINHSLFNRMVINRTFHLLRLRSSGHKGIDHLPPAIDDDLYEEDNAVNELQYVEDKLKHYESLNVHNNFHASIYRYIFDQGISARKLAKATGIPRYTISQSKKHIQNKVKQWIIEGRKNNTIMEVRAVIGINRKGEKKVFASPAMAAKSGFANVRFAIEKGTPVKGFNWSFVDQDTKEIQEVEKAIIPAEAAKPFEPTTMEEALHGPGGKPTQGLGDVVAKVIDKIPTPVVDAVKNLIWGEDGDCGCDERREKLNDIRVFSHASYKAVRFFTPAEYEQYRPFVENRKKKPGKEGMRTFAKMHASIFNHRYKDICASCGGGIQLTNMMADLRVLWLKAGNEDGVY